MCVVECCVGMCGNCNIVCDFFGFGIEWVDVIIWGELDLFVIEVYFGYFVYIREWFVFLDDFGSWLFYCVCFFLLVLGEISLMVSGWGVISLLGILVFVWWFSGMFFCGWMILFF